MKSFKSFYEAMTFKVDVEGLPVMYVDGNSPGEVKNHLRKLVKQPSMIKSVKRQTKHDVKKMYRDKAQGKEVAEMTQQSKTHPNLKIAVGKSAQSVKDTKARAVKRKANKQGTSLAAGTSGEVDYGTDQSIKIMKKKTPGETQEGNGLWANIHAKRRSYPPTRSRMAPRVRSVYPPCMSMRRTVSSAAKVVLSASRSWACSCLKRWRWRAKETAPPNNAPTKALSNGTQTSLMTRLFEE